MGFRKSEKEQTCPSKQGCTQRFKGIENFLRRIAFNLGNTPSQTEVKIISCIPIDVSDLQQKVISLEKQLKEARCAPSCSSNRSESKKSSVHPIFTKNRFRAKNGNCVEMNEPTSSYDRQKSNEFANDFQFQPKVIPSELLRTGPRERLRSNERTGNQGGVNSCKEINNQFENKSDKNKSNVSFVYPRFKSRTNEEITYPIRETISQLCTYENIDVPTSDSVTPISPQTQQEPPKKTFFKKRKKLVKDKNKTQCVYYAQARNSPFNRSEADNGGYPSKEDAMNRSYLADMIQKQYKPRPLADNLSTISKFTSPICRDIPPGPDDRNFIDPEICSCFHQPFHNIDNHNNMTHSVQAYMINHLKTGNTYYDSSLYDLVPVKEKSAENKRDVKEIPTKTAPDLCNKPQVDMMCWPGEVHSKYYHNQVAPEISPFSMNYVNYTCQGNVNVVKHLKNKSTKRPTREVINRNPKHNKQLKRKYVQNYNDASVSNIIDFGSVYKKINYRPRRQRGIEPVIISKTTKVACVGPVQPPYKNAECCTTVMTNHDCQTFTSSSHVSKPETKTAVTINQIKTILQSVLTEVKGTVQTKMLPQEKYKKDAFVQKGFSQNMMEGSHFINSITYSPYNVNPYLAPWSRDIAAHYQQNALKFYPNMPFFIQPSGRLCNCYNSSQLTSNFRKPAITTATNTDHIKHEANQGGNETDKLIHEIYKSMALSMEMPNKDTSPNKYNDIQSSKSSFQNQSEVKQKNNPVRSVVQVVSELFIRKSLPADTSDTGNETNYSRLYGSITDDRVLRHKLEQIIVQPSTSLQSEKTILENPSSHEDKQASTEEDTSDTESDTTTILSRAPSPGSKKVGLLTKLKSVFKNKENSNKNKIKHHRDDEAANDSDDYQTVYSQKVAKPLKHKHPTINIVFPRRKTHSKITYQRRYPRATSPEKPKRSPYIEHEYRRYWDERIMSQNKDPQSTSVPLTESTQRTKKSDKTMDSAYYKNYEARSALVEPRPRYAELTQEAAPMYSKTGSCLPHNDHGVNNSTPIATRGSSWLKKHKMGLNCGEQWKKFILEN